MSDLAPLVFIAMPFGQRRDPVSGCQVDFDDIYLRAITPAIEAVGLEGIRGDEEATGGIIMKAVYERLLLAEIVIADLTLQNPNVLYEVGVRHCAKPRSTILMFADTAPLPFDVAMVRAIPYSLENGALTDQAAEILQDELSKRLEIAITSSEATDSPLSQLFPEFPHVSFPQKSTESFQKRVRGLDSFRRAISDALASSNHETAAKILNNIEIEIGKLHDANLELFIDLMFAYRDIESWIDMVRVSDVIMGHPAAQTPVVIQQRALALNRRNEGADRDIAERELLELIDRRGDDSETCGILGRIFKSRYQEAAGYDDERQNHSLAIASIMQGNAQALGYMARSIEWYERGFLSDPRDYYPGINEATLRFVRWREEDQEKLKILLPTVLFAVGRIGAGSDSDYWLRATELEIQVLSEDWALAERSVERVLGCDAPDWMLKTTANNLSLIREARRIREEEFTRIDALLMHLPQ